jgi:hypothetical protein
MHSSKVSELRVVAEVALRGVHGFTGLNERGKVHYRFWPMLLKGAA